MLIARRAPRPLPPPAYTESEPQQKDADDFMREERRLFCEKMKAQHALSMQRAQGRVGQADSHHTQYGRVGSP